MGNQFAIRIALRRFTFCVGIVAVMASLESAAWARTMHWEAVEVEAFLNDEGSLEIIERQIIRMTGQWNGGERVFRVEPGQGLELHMIIRKHPDGRQIDLSPGSTYEVDTYRFDGQRVRWRSRLESDPPFADERLVYELHYTLKKILGEQKGGYWLSHEFLFRDRIAPIARASVTLSFAQVWTTPDGRPFKTIYRSATGLSPGHGIQENLWLQYEGASSTVRPWRTPLGARQGRWVGLTLMGLALAYWLGRRLVERKREAGFYRSLGRVAGVDEHFLRENLLRYEPEVVAAVWDDTVGNTELAVLLTRLEQEGKLRVDNMGSMGFAFELLCGRKELDPMARAVLDGMFVDGSTRTSQQELQAYYGARSLGFSPMESLRPALRTAVDAHPELRSLEEARKFGDDPPTFAMTLATVIVFLLSGLEVGFGALMPRDLGLIAMVLGLMCASVVHKILAFVLLKRVHEQESDLLVKPWMDVARVMVGVPPYLAFVAAIDLGLLFSFPQFAVLTCITGVSLCMAFSGLLPSGTPLRNARRRDFELARLYFEQELKKPRPAIDDSWTPYLIALDLRAPMKVWYKSHGPHVIDEYDDSDTSLGSGVRGTAEENSSPPPRPFSGGGGTFGGGGASGSWEVAIDSLHVASPASTSGGDDGVGGGGGGGDTGDTDSGGGGGGGW